MQEYRSQIVSVISMAVETGEWNRMISSLSLEMTFHPDLVPLALGCNFLLRVRRRLDPSGARPLLLCWLDAFGYIRITVY